MDAVLDIVVLGRSAAATQPTSRTASPLRSMYVQGEAASRDVCIRS